jgi:hypothetical protein
VTALRSDPSSYVINNKVIYIYIIDATCKKIPNRSNISSVATPPDLFLARRRKKNISNICTVGKYGNFNLQSSENAPTTPALVLA